MPDSSISQAELSAAIDAVPGWLLGDHYAAQTLRTLAELVGLDQTPESVDHSMGFRVRLDSLLDKLRKSPHIEEDADFVLDVATMARSIVRQLPYEYPADAISDGSRQGLLLLSSQLDSFDLDESIKQQRETLRELEALSSDLKDEYEKRSTELDSIGVAWEERLDEWTKHLDPKAAELVGAHYGSLLSKRRTKIVRRSYGWLVATGLLFAASVFVAVLQVFDLSSVIAIELPGRVEQPDGLTSPLSGLALVAISTGAMAWTGRRYQHKAEDARQLEDLADRLSLAAKLDATELDPEVVPPRTYQLVENLVQIPLTSRPVLPQLKDPTLRSQVTEIAKSIADRPATNES